MFKNDIYINMLCKWQSNFLSTVKPYPISMDSCVIALGTPVYNQGFWYFAEKKAKFRGIFRGKFAEKSADFAGFSREEKSKVAEKSADFARF